MSKKAAKEALNDVVNTGHSGSIYSANQAGVSDAFIKIKTHSKTNSAADPNVVERYRLTRDECERRGVRFLPAQVMRPILRAAGL